MPRRTVLVDPGFGRELKELREQHGLSLRRLGRIVHCSHGYLWDLETGSKRPSPAVVVLLDEALGASGRLSAMVREVSTDITLGPAPDRRQGVDAAVDLWRSDAQRSDLSRSVEFRA